MTSTRTAQIAEARAADTRIAAAWAEFYKLDDQQRDYVAKARKARKIAAGYTRADWKAERIAAAVELEKLSVEMTPAVEAARSVARELDDLLYKGWSRFFLVQHIHSSTSCSSFRPTTKIGWLPDVSGLTEAEAVAAHGATLCTICFPSAPVELTRTQVDPDTCAGSGRGIDRSLPTRDGFMAGNYATCGVCSARVGIRRGAYNVPKHKTPAA
jgi:hypothetical protein